MQPSIITPEALRRARELRDLLDPAQGPHAMQLLLERIRTALAERWGCDTLTHRADPVVSTADNYDRLRYPPEGAARDARYTRYVAPDKVLRTQTSAMIPPLLRHLATSETRPRDVLLLCPGLVYRRDTIDRLHTGEPHQADLWRIAAHRLSHIGLREMIETVVHAALPQAEHRCNPAEHPYTRDGLEIEVRLAPNDEWVEIGECGLAHPDVLADAGLSTATYTGLAMGLGVDRILMLAKGIDDIRLLRSPDPRIAAQMADLEPYRPVSNQPAIRRDLSAAVEEDTTPEEIGDQVRAALAERAESLESVEILSETPHDHLPPQARERLGMRAGQKNVLVRMVIRDLARTLTDAEANALRDEVYAALHRGSVWHWASPHPPAAARTRLAAGANAR